MVHEGTILFVNPELLKTEISYDALKDYLSKNTPAPYTKINAYADGKIYTEILTFDFGTFPGTAGYFAVLDDYCCMTLETLKKFVGIYD